PRRDAVRCRQPTPASGQRSGRLPAPALCPRGGGARARRLGPLVVGGCRLSPGRDLVATTSGGARRGGGGNPRLDAAAGWPAAAGRAALRRRGGVRLALPGGRLTGAGRWAHRAI